MEVGRSSSQSALSERPGRWNGPRPVPVGRDSGRGEQPGARGRPAHIRMTSPPSTSRPRGGHAASGSGTGSTSQASHPGRRASSRRGAGARDLLSKPACRRMHGRSETFPAVGMAALPPLTPGGQAGGRSMTCLVARHARHADLSEPPLVHVCRTCGGKVCDLPSKPTCQACAAVRSPPL